VFRGLVNDAKVALSSLVLQYLARASVAVPFSFRSDLRLPPSSSHSLSGSVAADWVMAGGLAVVGNNPRVMCRAIAPVFVASAFAERSHWPPSRVRPTAWRASARSSARIVSTISESASAPSSASPI
jgi:hypothetical protein